MAAEAALAGVEAVVTMGTAATDGQYHGVRGFTARRPLTMFLLLTFGIGWVIATVANATTRPNPVGPSREMSGRNS
jgi:hypothetical protein